MTLAQRKIKLQQIFDNGQKVKEIARQMRRANPGFTKAESLRLAERQVNRS